MAFGKIVGASIGLSFTKQPKNGFISPAIPRNVRRARRDYGTQHSRHRRHGRRFLEQRIARRRVRDGATHGVDGQQR